MATKERSARRWWRDRDRLLAMVAVGLGLLAVSAGVIYQVVKRPPDVHNGTKVAFKPPPPKKVVKPKTTNWPFFGFDRARTRYLPAKGVKPPYRKLWDYGAKPLLEFPPVYVNGHLYFIDNNGRVFALDANTGHILWKRDIAQLNASGPAYSHGGLYFVNL